MLTVESPVALEVLVQDRGPVGVGGMVRSGWPNHLFPPYAPPVLYRTSRATGLSIVSLAAPDKKRTDSEDPGGCRDLTIQV